MTKPQKIEGGKKRVENKEILDDLIRKSKGAVKKLTYIELGIFLGDIGFDADWVSLGDAHDYLGGYENESEDSEIKTALDKGDILTVTKIIYSKL